MRNAHKHGFSLIEVLVVIAIIGILTAIGVSTFIYARESAKISKAKAELHEIVNAMTLLAHHTGKTPGGCPVGGVFNPETPLDSDRAGLATAPAVYDSGQGCSWTANDLLMWSGPYINSAIDPWEKAYEYDPDYHPYQSCPDTPSEPVLPAIFSYGPDGAPYTCDDMFIDLSEL